MAAFIEEYPSSDAEPFVRGDPATFIFRIRVQGVDQDISDWTWRSHVRSGYDAALVSECETFDVVAPADLPGYFDNDTSTVPCVLLARWTPEQTALWRQGFVSDIEALTPVKYTWAIMGKLRVRRDASYTSELP